MTKRYLNTLLIFALVLVVAGAGYYQTEVQQPKELQRIDDSKKLARLQQARVEQLFAEEASSAELAAETMRRWRARYKYLPAELTTSEIVEYLRSLSSSGFEQFQFSLSSQGATPDFKFFLFDLSGTAYYESLYRFVWHIENNREFFYHVHDLNLSHVNVFKTNEETGEQKLLDMAQFTMKLKVFYAGTEGLSAPTDEPLDFPEILLPAKQLAHDSFYPIVRTDLPPNDELLVDVENAYLLSIVGDQAVFQDKNGQHFVREGDRVYLGQIVKIDPANLFVRASLNKGGVIEVVEAKMEFENQYSRYNLGTTPRNN